MSTSDLSAKVRDGRYRGLLVPWRGLGASSLWDTHSSYDEQGLRPGPAVPQAINFDSRWDTSGTIQQGTDLWVQGLVGGFAGPELARIVWQQGPGTGVEPTDLWSGWDMPNTITAGPEVIEFLSVTPLLENPYVLTVANDGVLLCYESDEGAARVAYTRSRDASTRLWSSSVALVSEADQGDKLAPCSCLLPDGRVLLFVATHDGAESQVDVYQSTDDGTTFALAAAAVLRTVIDATVYSLQRLRARAKDGQILLIAWVTKASGTDRETLIQYASDDVGNTFTEIDVGNLAIGVDVVGYPDVVVAGGRFVVGVIPAGPGGSGTSQPGFYQLANAFEPIFDGSIYQIPLVENPGTYAGGVFMDGDLAICVDEDEAIFAYWMATTSTEPGVMGRSLDYGETWTGVGAGPSAGNFGYWYDSQQASPTPAGRPIRLAVCAQRGRVIMVHGSTGDSATGDNGLWASYLGGYSTVTMPKIDKFVQGSRQAGFEYYYLPFEDLPTMTSAWAITAAGGATASLLAGLWAMSAPTGGTYLVDSPGVASTAVAGRPIFLKVSCRLGAGGAGYWIANVRHTDNGGSSFDYEVEARVISTGVVEFRDVVAASLSGTVSMTTVGVFIDVLLAINATDSYRHATCYVREATTDEDRQYELVGTSSSMVSRGATTAVGRLRWGIGSSTAGLPLLVEQRRAQGNLSGTYAGQPLQLENEQDNPGQLFGPSASTPELYINDGVKIAARGAEMFRGQTWRIVAEADYPAEHALVSSDPSPQRAFRSAGARVAGADAATTALVEPQTLAYQLNASAEDNAYGDLDGFYLDSNAREGLIEERTGGSWSTVIDFDNRFAVTFARKGNVIVPDLRTQLSGGPTPTSSGPYLAPDDLAGAVFEFGSGETKTIPIVGNTEGIWIEGRAPDPVSQLVPRLELDGDYLDGTEPTLGTGWFWWPRVLFVYRRTTWAEREGIRLVLHDASPGISPPDELSLIHISEPTRPY